MSVWILGIVALSIVGNNNEYIYNKDWKPERRIISSTYEVMANEKEEAKEREKGKVKTEYLHVKDSVIQPPEKKRINSRLKSEIKHPLISSMKPRKAEQINPFLKGLMDFFDDYGLLTGFIALVVLFAGFRVIKN